jgi:hypothetical protein
MLFTLHGRRAASFVLLLVLLIAGLPFRAHSAPVARDGFTPIFDGKTLNGWTLVNKAGRGYVAQNGVLTCPADGGGNLFTEKEYADFVLRFEFQLSPGGNNGVAIRAPLDGDAAYVGMEVQILDDSAPGYARLEPSQYHGSIYKVAAARRGALKPAGEWNREEIRAVGRRVTVTLNGVKILDTDLNRITDAEILRTHPGMRRDRGHIGFLGHGSLVRFRNIAVQDLSKPERDNRPPAGFHALFNGRDLTGWKGLVADPPARAKMPAAELAEAQKKADAAAREHWRVVNGVLAYDGKANSLCTVQDYGDFEMLVDWKIEPGGDSGIYLRGSPQVQIWDDPVGSGGLYNNEKNPSRPIKKADNPPGQWNRFRILMIGDRVTVHLNDELVVNDVVMENYWERGRPIYPTGQIELQHHGAPLYFKNIYLREIAPPAATRR